jgi:hypothetical protein
MKHPRQRPPMRMPSPAEVFILYVTWCTLGIVVVIATLLLLPWSLPFGIAAFVFGGYVLARYVRDLRSN